MPVSYLDIAGTYTGPGSFNFGVAAYPGGAQLFVNSATGQDSRGRITFMGTPSSLGTQPISAQGPYGDPNKPLATIFGPNGAISFCKAGRGDTIIVSPGHVENLVAGATTIPAGVSIIGGGYGSARPTISYTIASSFLTCGGPGCQLQNLIFDLTQVAGVVKGFLINTSGFQFNLCRILQSTVTNQATDAVVLNLGADDFLFISSEVDATGAAVTGHGISNPAANNIARLYIANSDIHGNWTLGGISILSTGSTEMLVEANILRNYNAAVFPVFLAAGNTITGVFNNNFIMMAGTGATQFISGGGGTGIALLQNYAWDTKASTSSGILIPAAGTL